MLRLIQRRAFPRFPLSRFFCNKAAPPSLKKPSLNLAAQLTSVVQKQGSPEKGLSILHSLDPTKGVYSVAAELKKAIVSLEGALDSNPPPELVAQIHFSIGLCHAHKRQWPQVIEQNTLALENDSNYVPSFFYLGEALLGDDSYHPSIENYDLFLSNYATASIDPKYSALKINWPDLREKAYFNRAWMNYHLSEFEKAEKDWEQVCKLGGPQANSALGWIADITLLAKDLQKAVELSTKALEENPSNLRALQVRFMAYTFLQDKEKAQADEKLYDKSKIIRLWNAWEAPPAPELANKELA